MGLSLMMPVRPAINADVPQISERSIPRNASAIRYVFA
jgi:hypothetical protein